jgi:hypothetical protein
VLSADPHFYTGAPSDLMGEAEATTVEGVLA